MMEKSKANGSDVLLSFALVMREKVLDKIVMLNSLPLEDKVAQKDRTLAKGHLGVKECRIRCGLWFVRLPEGENREQVVEDPS